MTTVLLSAVRFHVMVLLLPVLGQQVFTVQSKTCKPGNNESCFAYFSWQGCYLLDNLKSSFKRAGYEELFQDRPVLNESIQVWQSRFSNLACRCAHESSRLGFDFFALQFYSVCYGGIGLFNAKNQEDRACFKINATECKKKNNSLCFRVGTNTEAGIYRLVRKNSTIPYAQCSGNQIVDGGKYVNVINAKTMASKTGKSEDILIRMFKELDNNPDIDERLKIIKNIINAFKRPEIYENFDIFKKLQESFMTTLSKVVGENFKHLWKKTVKVQYLVEMVQEMSVLTLRSLSFTKNTEYSFQTTNIDISANISSDSTLSLHFNDTTTDSFIILDNSLQGMSSRPSSIAAILYKGINDIFPANHEQEKSVSNISLSVVASPVVSIVLMHDGKLIKNINGTIRLKKMADKREGLAHPSCVYWKKNSSFTLGGAWSTTGLSLSTDNHHGNQSNTDYFTCRMNHLTSFAVLMQDVEGSQAALLRMFKELDNCVDIDQILKIIKKIISVFKRPEIYKSFDIFKKLQESFMTTLSKVVGENFKHLWKKTVKVQYLVEMVQEMSVLTLRSLSFTNNTEYSFQTTNIDVSANFSSDTALSLHFNDTTTDSSIILDNSLQGMSSRPSSIAAILYKGINDIFPAKQEQETSVSNISLSVVASPVVSIVSMHDGNLVKNINGTIRLKKMADKRESSLSHPSCVYWKENSSFTLGGAWSTTGLSLSTDNNHGDQSNTDYFTCRTNHLTSFAILMLVKDFDIPRVHVRALALITYFGCSLSLLCLLLTIITIPIIRLKETRFRIHHHLCIALAVSQALFLSGMAAVNNKVACMVVAMFLHYFYTAAFMWMLIEGIHLYQKIVIAYEVRNVKERLYFLFAWGFPLIIVVIAFAANRDGYGTKRGCWLSLEKGFRWAFIAPVITVLLANFVILIKVLIVMVSLQSDPLRPEKHGKIRLACKGVAILLPLLGLTWFFGIMSVNSDTIVFQYLFAIFNSLQGVFIFVFNYVSNKEVRMSIRRTIHRSQMSSL